MYATVVVFTGSNAEMIRTLRRVILTEAGLRRDAVVRASLSGAS